MTPDFVRALALVASKINAKLPHMNSLDQMTIDGLRVTVVMWVSGIPSERRTYVYDLLPSLDADWVPFVISPP